MVSTNGGSSSSAAGEDALLLREFAHRTGNELAVAISALSLASRRGLREGGRTLVDAAVARLEALAGMHRLLARPPAAEMDLGAEVGAICVAMRNARDAGGTTLDLDLQPLPVDGATGRRILLAAAELVSNSFSHALKGREGRLAVSLRRRAGELTLVVADDGPNARTASAGAGTGYGSGIVADLVAGARGRMTVERGKAGTTVSVRAPLVRGVDAHAG